MACALVDTLAASTANNTAMTQLQGHSGRAGGKSSAANSESKDVRIPTI